MKFDNISSSDGIHSHSDGNRNQAKWAVLSVATLSAFIAPFLSSSVNVALPSIAEDLRMDAILLGWVAMSYTLTLAILMLPFGRLADIWGRRRVFLYGSSIFTTATLLCAISPSDFALIGFRILQAVGASMIFSTSLAIVSSVFPLTERGGAFGIYVAAVYLGLSAGPFLGGMLTHTFGWRSIFMASFPLGLAMTFLTFWKLERGLNEGKSEKFDFTGAALYGLALATLTYGLSQLPELLGSCLVASGIAIILVFVKWETRVSSPLLDVTWFRNNLVFALSSLAALIHYSATFAVTFLLSLYLQYIHEFTPQTAGLILIAQPIMQTLLSPLTGRLSDRIEPRIVASVGMALTATGLLLLIFLSESTSLIYIVVSLVVLGVGYAFFSSPNTNAMMSSVEERQYGVASGLVATSRSVGMLLSMGIAVVVLAVYMGDVEITQQHYSSLVTSVKVAFVIFTCLCFLGIFASLARGRVK